MTQHRLQDQVFLKDLIEAISDELRFEVVEALEELLHFSIDDDNL